MAGQIEKRGEGRYRIRWFLGRDEKGRRRYGSRTIRGKKRDAERALRKIQANLDAGIIVESRAIGLGRYLDEWLEAGARPRVREQTLTRYKELLDRYVRPALGTKRLDRVQPLDVQRMVSELEARGLAPQTVRNAHAVLSGALRQAVRWQLLDRNPAAYVDLPKRRHAEVRALTPEEADAFRAAVAGDRHEALFLTLLGTGLRPSEALGLRWGDVDLEAGELVVRRRLVEGKVEEGPRYEAPKSAQGRRTVALPSPVVAALRGLRGRQAKERLRAGEAWEDHELVFTTRLGRPLDRRNVIYRHFKLALERAELPESLRLYDLRHTNATLRLLSGAHPKVVSEALGHASAAFTLDTYTHVQRPMQEDAAARLERVLFGRDGAS